MKKFILTAVLWFKMADLLTSEAAFKEHAEARGLSAASLTALTGQGLTTLSGLAYCLTVPGLRMPFANFLTLPILQVSTWPRLPHSGASSLKLKR